MDKLKRFVKLKCNFKTIFIYAIILASFRFIVTFKEFMYIARDFSYGNVLYLSGIFMEGPLIEVSLCIAIFPVITQAFDDYRSGFYMYTVPRTGLETYSRANIILNNIYVFLISFLGHTLLALVLSIFMDFGPEVYINELQGMEKLKYLSPYLYFYLKNFLISLSFVVWSFLGQSLIFYLKNKHISILGAVFCYTLFNDGAYHLKLLPINKFLWGGFSSMTAYSNLGIGLLSNIGFLCLAAYLYKRSIRKAVVS